MSVQPISRAKFAVNTPWLGALIRLVILALIPAWLMIAGQASAMEKLVYLSVPGESKVEIFGTSTMHDWTAQGNIILGSVVFLEELQAKLDDVDKAFPLVKAKHVSLDCRIPVKSLKSDSEGLNEEMYKSLDCQEHPEVAFTFTSASFTSHPMDTQYVFKVKGLLHINGVKRPHDLSISATQISRDELVVSTETTLKMTDFKITPPTFLGGLLQSGDQVKLKLAWGLKRKIENIDDTDATER